MKKKSIKTTQKKSQKLVVVKKQTSIGPITEIYDSKGRRIGSQG